MDQRCEVSVDSLEARDAASMCEQMGMDFNEVVDEAVEWRSHYQGLFAR